LKRVLPFVTLLSTVQLAQAADIDLVHNCPMPVSAQSTTALNVLPQPVMAVLRERVPNLSPAEAPFNAGDIVLPGQKGLDRRFMRAFVSGSRWVIAYEAAGIGYHHHVIAIERPPNGDSARILANIQVVGQTICAELARWANPNYPMASHW
jgi:hypothetical protein